MNRIPTFGISFRRIFVTTALAFWLTVVSLLAASQSLVAKDKPKDDPLFTNSFFLQDGNGDPVGRIIDFSVGDFPLHSETNFTDIATPPVQKYGGMLLHVLIPFNDEFRLVNFEVHRNAPSVGLLPTSEIRPISYFTILFTDTACSGVPYLGPRSGRLQLDGSADSENIFTVASIIEEAILFERRDLNVLHLYKLTGPMELVTYQSWMVNQLTGPTVCTDIIGIRHAFPLELEEFDLYDLFPKPYSIELTSQ